MNAVKRTLLVSCGMFALSACSQATTPAPLSVNTAADEAAFRAGTALWVAAYNAGDVDKIVALYAEDAVMMPPDAPNVTGRAEMRAYLTQNVAASKAAGIRLADGTSSAGASGNLGWHAGTFSVIDAAGKPVGTGKYSEVWQRVDGKWLIIRDTGGNDAPPQHQPSDWHIAMMKYSGGRARGLGSRAIAADSNVI